jgi:hypothetical protein
MSYQKIYFQTFGNSKFYEALERIKKEATKFELFEKIFIYNDKDLKNDNKFWKEHGEFINKNSRFYGYAIWKPYLILKSLESINYGDILLYCDAGCELNYKGKERLLEYINIINSNDKSVLCFELKQIENMWNKMDLIDKLNAHDLLNTPQILSGVGFFKKTEKSIKLLTDWYNLSNEYHLIDDTPSILPNHIEFKEHRHDQSLFSLLCKKYDANILQDETYYWPWTSEYKKEYITKPILASRNSRNVSIIDFS